MGDLFGRPRVVPLLLGLTGTIPACHLSSQNVWPFQLPSASGDCRSKHPIVRYGTSNRAFEIFPLFLPHGRSHRLRTIGGNDKLFFC